MAGSEFYDHTTFPSQGSAGSSSSMRAELELIESGFGKVSPLSGNGDKAVFINSTGTSQEAKTAAQARALLGLVLGTDVQAFDSDLAAIAALSSAADKLLYATGAQTWALTAFTAAARALLDDADASAMLNTLGIAPAQMSNLWINSDFGVNQRGLTSVADGAYCLDRTYVLTESGNLTYSQLAQPTDGIPYAMRLTQPDVSAKRMGGAQAVEARNCLAYRGSNLVFVPKLRSSAGGTLHAALLAHTGTADSITRDVINTWASTTYTPGNFFIASNLTVIAAGSVVATANAWTDVPVSSASAGGIVAPSGINNLILVFWTESAQAQNATLDASIMRAGLGVNTPIWTPPDAQQELARCQRYYENSFLYGTAPAQNVGSNVSESTSMAVRAGANIHRLEITYKVPKRVPPPTITLYNPSAANGEARDINAAADCSSTSVTFTSDKTFLILTTTNAGTAISNRIGVNWEASAEL